MSSNPKPKPARSHFSRDPLAAALRSPKTTAPPISDPGSSISAPDDQGRLDQILARAASRREEDIDLAQITPDFWQGRRILPRALHGEHAANRLSAEAAIRAWLASAAGDAVAARKLADIEALATSLDKRDQINASVVVPDGLDVAGPRYKIVAGERRYWSAWLAHVRGQRPARTLRVVIIPAFDLDLQIDENATQRALNAVETARVAARAFLDALGITPERYPALTPGDDAFYRLAASPIEELLPGRQRAPRGVLETVATRMGLSAQRQVERYLQILTLSETALTFADEHDTTERILRVLIEGKADPERQVAVLAAVEAHGLSSAQAARLAAAQDLAAELAQIKREGATGESGEGEGTEPGEPVKKTRPTPARRRAGVQLADRLSGVGKLVRSVASGEKVNDQRAMERIVDEAVALRPKEAAVWLGILEPIVARLRQKLKTPVKVTPARGRAGRTRR